MLLKETNVYEQVAGGGHIKPTKFLAAAADTDEVLLNFLSKERCSNCFPVKFFPSFLFFSSLFFCTTLSSVAVYTIVVSGFTVTATWVLRDDIEQSHLELMSPPKET